MRQISLCMITKNEQEHLKRCLESVKEIVSEIIVVDTGSSDKTKEIAREYTEKIYDFRWADDFSLARNFSLEKATKDWILVLDADEFIEKTDARSIVRILEKTDAYGLTLIVRNYTNDSSVENWVPCHNFGFSGFFPSKLVRIFRSDPQIRFEGRVHEQVRPSIERINEKNEFVEIPIHHPPTTAIHAQKKREYYVELLKKKVRENPSALAYFEQGVALKELDLLEEALESFREALKIQKEFIPAYLEIGQILKQQKRYEDASKSYSEALKLNENSAAAYFGLGICKYRLGKSEEAEVLLKKSLSINPNDPKALTSLGAILEKGGKLEQARKALEMSITLNPKNPQAYLNLGRVLEKLGKISESEQAYQRAVELNHPKSELIKEKIKTM